MASHHGHLQEWGGGYSTVEDLDRASPGKPSLQGMTSLGFGVPVLGSASNCLGT